MLEESAIVVKIEQGIAWVVGTQNNACSGCAQKAGCGSNALDSVLSVLKKKPLPVDSEIFLQVGDTVIVAIDEVDLLRVDLLRAAFFLYLLPVCALLTGAGIADSLINHATPYADLWIASSAFASLALAFLAIKKIQQYALLNYYTRPVVVKKC
jgi:sigma-E factor negative regulatory protein RseC